ncbi:MAG: phage protease, partial [Planctomycetota bacterium]
MEAHNALATYRSNLTLPVASAQPPAPGRGTMAAAVPEWVMIARAGTWLGHPTTPEIITHERLQSALDYYRRHYAAYGADLVVDYHHASVIAPGRGARAPAAGWIQQLGLRNEGSELWGRVMWTAEAASAIAQRKFRYLSPVLRFDSPDRVTGRPVPMAIHSVALTNTPFLTELEGLNQNAAGAARSDEAPTMDGQGMTNPPAEGGKSMSLLDGLAALLEREPQQVASELGLDAEGGLPDDATLAMVLMENAATAKELKHGGDQLEEVRGRLEEEEARTTATANALGLPADADAARVRAAILRLKAPDAGLAAVRARLGVAEDAPEAEVLNAIAALQESRRKREAEELVDGAVQAGRIPPAHRDFYMREAVNDPEAAREVINSLPVLTAPANELGRRP